MKRAQPSKFRKTNTDQVQVYCRIKPPKDSASAIDYIEALSPTLLRVITPENGRGSRETNYVFRQIFSVENPQKEIFDTVAMPLIDNLLNGENGLLFSYGVTGSGKTFTMNGDKSKPGIIPRTVSAVFNTIGPLHAPKCIFKLDNQNGFIIQDENAAISDLLMEHRCKIAKKTSSENDIPCMLTDLTKVANINEDNLYAVFVSYVEIYNNFIVDLLDNSGKLLRLREGYSNVFIDELKEVEVRTNEEAMEKFNLGQKRKRMGITSLNKESSRSHSIFTIKIVQAPTDERGEHIVNDNSLITVSQLSLVDLAGSERHSKAQTTGQSLAEACNINNSLMFLRNCLNALRDNQTRGLNKKIQYRNCKLTHLFKNYFEGNGLIRMIICITPEVEDYNETVHVLEFAEMTQDIQTLKQYTNAKVTKFTPGRRRANQMMKDFIESENMFDLRLPPALTFDNVMVDLPPLTFSTTTEGLLALQNLVNHLEVRFDRHKSLVDEYNEKSLKFREALIDIEKENILKNFELSNLQNINEDIVFKLKKLEEKNLEYEQKIKELTNAQIEKDKKIQTLTEATKEKERQMSQLIIDRKKDKQKLTQKVEKMNAEVENKLEAEKKRLKTQYEQRTQKLNIVRRILEQPTPSSSEINLNEIANSKKTMEKIDRDELPAPGSVKRLIAQTQQKVKMNVAAQQYRRRRSKSCGDRWIEHKPVQNPINQGTLLQPVAHITKSVKKLNSIKDVTNSKTSRYFLQSQEKEENGDISTKFYKGDVIPTISGGAQVIFDDVEILKQESPISLNLAALNGVNNKRSFDKVVCDDVAVADNTPPSANSRSLSPIQINSRCNSAIVGHGKKLRPN